MLSLEVNAPKKSNKILSSKNQPKLIIGILATLLVLAILGMGYLYYHYVAGSDTPVKTEDELITEAVGSRLLIPDEKPSIATVTDKTKLADQPFFKKAENGDKILIFTNAGKAVLYRPKIKKVIDTTIISLTPEAGQENASGTMPTDANEKVSDTEDDATTEPAERLNIAIYNGSQKIGITNSFDDVLKETAQKSDYEKSVIVDVTKLNAPFVKELAGKISGTVGELPEGEKAPENTDILIILGNNDYKQVP